MAKKKRPACDPAHEQLVFPLQLQVGDIIVEDVERSEVAAPPKSGPAGRTIHAWVRAEGEAVQRTATWEAWRKLRVIRRSAA